jgi:hydrogenase small subunit
MTAAPENPLPDTIKEVHAFWLAGGSCDGCSIATVGATAPSAEALMNGKVPGVPKVVLHHPVLSVEAGKEFMAPYQLAASGELEAPFVVLYEGSLMNEELAKETGGYWAGLGVREVDGEPQPVSTAEWLKRMSEHAAAVICVGTCATWGGVPAAAGSPTDAMGVIDFLGEEYRSTLGLPVVNIPGCAPQGDNITETITAVLMFLNGCSGRPSTGDVPGPVTTRRALSPRNTEIRSASWRSDAGGRWCSAI